MSASRAGHRVVVSWYFFLSGVFKMGFWSAVASFSSSLENPSGSSSGGPPPKEPCGIANECDKSSLIQDCAIAENNRKFKRRIVGAALGSNNLVNNVSHTSNAGGGDNQESGLDGKSISNVQWNQHYFEHVLGWDFSTVWEWDSNAKQPMLRKQSPAALAAKTNAIPQQQPNDGQTSLLLQQLQANIWLRQG